MFARRLLCSRPEQQCEEKRAYASFRGVSLAHGRTRAVRDSLRRGPLTREERVDSGLRDRNILVGRPGTHADGGDDLPVDEHR